MIWRIAGTVLGLALLLLSLPLTLSPLPFGLILMFIAVVILVASNPLAARLLRALRRRYPWLDRFFNKAEDVLPEELAEPLRATDNPDDEEQGQASGSAPPMRRVRYPRYLR